MFLFSLTCDSADAVDSIAETLRTRAITRDTAQEPMIHTVYAHLQVVAGFGEVQSVWS